MDLARLAQQWIAGRVARGELVAGSARVETTRLRSLLRLYDTPDELTRASLLAWQAAVGHMSPAARKAYKCTVTGFCRWLVEEGHLDVDPSAKLAKVKLPRRVPRTLQPLEVQRTFAGTYKARERLIVWLMYGCGLRACEVSGADLDHYDPVKEELWVTGKFGNERMVPVPPEVKAAIDLYLEQRGDGHGPLIRATDRNHQNPERRVSPDRISRIVRRLMGAVGVHRARDRRTGHAFRHTCLSDVFDACKDLTVVQELAGHKSLATTEVYLRVAGRNRMRAAMADRHYLADTGTEGGRSPTLGDDGPLRGAGSRGATSPQAADPTERQNPDAD